MRSFAEFLERKRREFGSQFDPTKLDRRFVPYFESGARISVKFAWGEVKRGTVGVTSGWAPVFLLMLRSSDRGSSWTLGPREMIVPHVSKRRSRKPRMLFNSGLKRVYRIRLGREILKEYRDERSANRALKRMSAEARRLGSDRGFTMLPVLEYGTEKKPRTLFNMGSSKTNPDCVVCHGDLVFMGALGNLQWFRCRACGMEQSRKARARRKVRKNNDTVKIIKCACGARLELYGDTECDRCGQWYNAFGQRLKDPSQWSKGLENRGKARKNPLFGSGRSPLTSFKSLDDAMKLIADLDKRGIRGGWSHSPTGRYMVHVPISDLRRLKFERARAPKNPLTRKEAARLLRSARGWTKIGGSHGYEKPKSYFAGRSVGIAEAVASTSKGARGAARKVMQKAHALAGYGPNPIESMPGGGFVVSGKATQLYRLIALKHAMKLELTTGMKMSRGISPFAIVKQELGFKGNKQKVYDQLVKYIEQVGPGLAQNPGGVFSNTRYWKVYKWDRVRQQKTFIAKIRATYSQIKRYFPGANLTALGGGIIGMVVVTKNSQVRVPVKVRK